MSTSLNRCLALLAVAVAPSLACDQITIQAVDGNGGTAPGVEPIVASSTTTGVGTGGGCPVALNGEKIIACGLPPSFSVVAFDASSVLAITALGVIVRVELATGAKTQLNFVANASVPASALGTRARAGSIFFTANDDASNPGAPLSLSSLLPGQLPQLLTTDVAARELALDATFVYYSGSSGGIRRVPQSGGPAATLSALNAIPLGVAGGSLYEFAAETSELARLTLPGGPLTKLATVQGSLTGLLFDLDADSIYWAETGTSQNQLKRQALAGGDVAVLASFMDGAQTAEGPGKALAIRADADMLYVLTDKSLLFRTPKAGIALDWTSFEPLGESTALPVLLASTMIVGRVTDGIENPLEGVLVERDK